MAERFFILDEFDESLLSDVTELYEKIDEQKNLRGGRVNVIVNSPGGSVDVLKAYLDAFEYAKKNDVIVGTFVTGEAASAGSILAINGTKGYRVIGRYGSHYIHWGQARVGSQSPGEAVRAFELTMEHYEFVFSQYKTHCKIPKLKKSLADEHFTLSAEECVAYGVADEIGVLA